MVGIRIGVVAAFLAAGVALLTACGSGGATPAAAPAGSGTAPAAAPAGGGAASANLAASLKFSNGTAAANAVGTDTGDFFNGPSESPQAMQWVQLSGGSAGALNPVVLNGAGFTLYRFDQDAPSPSRSNCNGACAKTWPPVLIRPGGRIFVDGVVKSAISVVRRDDGNLQVTLGGWPIYRFSRDTGPRQTNGQGVGGTWFGVAPDGKKAHVSPQGPDSGTGLNYKTGTAKQNHAAPNTGDDFNGPANDPAARLWVQLTAGSAGGLSPIVHNGVGFTLYRFDKDAANPSVSNCNGACAKTWPPVLVRQGSRIFVDGVETATIGIVQRADGSRQVTIGGWPIYRFSKDTAPGQTNGEGVGGTWFAISPLGGKVLPPIIADNGTPPPDNTATSAPPAY